MSETHCHADGAGPCRADDCPIAGKGPLEVRGGQFLRPCPGAPRPQRPVDARREGRRLEEIDPTAVYREDLRANPDFDRIRAAISITIGMRCGQVPDVHPRLHEAINAVSIELAQAQREGRGALHVEWHVEYGDPVNEGWTPHLRATGAEAARAALVELREADPKHRWRAVRHESFATVESSW